MAFYKLFTPLASLRSNTKIMIALGLALACTSACSSTREVPQVQMQRGGPLADWLSQQERVESEIVVQVYRTPSGMVFGDTERIENAALLGVPPSDVCALADSLKDFEWRDAGDGWIALGMDPTNNDAHFLFNYRGVELVIDGDVIIAQRGRDVQLPNGEMGRGLDMLKLGEGEFAYLNGRGNFATEALVQPLNSLEGGGGQRIAIVPDANPIVRFETKDGPIEVELFEDEQPLAVAAFLALVEQGYWDVGATIAYRVEPVSKLNDGENLKIVQFGTPSFRAPVEIPLTPSARSHSYGTLAMVSENGKLLPGHCFFQMDPRSVTSDEWTQKFPVIGTIIRGIDMELLQNEGIVKGPYNAYLLRVEAMQPGDEVKNASAVQQRYQQYTPIFEARLRSALGIADEE